MKFSKLLVTFAAMVVLAANVRGVATYEKYMAAIRGEIQEIKKTDFNKSNLAKNIKQKLDDLAAKLNRELGAAPKAGVDQKSLVETYGHLVAKQFEFISLATDQKEIEKDLAGRTQYSKGGFLFPIRFYAKDMLGEKYTGQHEFMTGKITSVIDPKKCLVVDGPFTYYKAVCHGFASADPKDVHQDFGWGCAWRASLNVLNKVKEWLEEKHNICAVGEYRDRQLNMYDIRGLANKNGWGAIGYHDWLEPAENAELFLRFIEEAYAPTDQEGIKKLLGLRGHYYAARGGAHGGNWKKVPLIKLREYLRLPAVATEANHKETLDEFYEFKDKSVGITADAFPKFGDEIGSTPCPLNVDDGALARNIYGICVPNPDTKVIENVFVGETHRGFGGRNESPWLCSGWFPVDEIFGAPRVMIFEIYIKS